MDSSFWVNCAWFVGFVTNTSYYGNGSLMLKHNESTIRRILRSQTVNGLEAGKYTVSGYIKTQDVSKVNGFGAEIFAIVVDSNGNSKTIEGDFVSGTNDWERHSLTFDVPANTSYIKICASITHESGTAWFDGIQLVSGEAANSYNLLGNASFERNNGGDSVPEGWKSNDWCQPGDGAAYAQGDKYGRDGNWSCRLVGNTEKNKYVSQEVKLNGTEGDVYCFSGWAMANAISNKGFRITAEVVYEDDQNPQWIDVDFNQNITTWQYASGIIQTKDPTGKNRRYKAIRIYLIYYNQCNEAFFDGIQLVKGNAQNYKYDDNGNLVSTNDAAKNATSLAYSNNNLSKMINSDGSSSEYKYDAKENVTSTKSSEGVKNNFSYDKYGNTLTSETLSSSAYSTSLVPGKTYYIRNKYTGKYISEDNVNHSLVQKSFDKSESQKVKITSSGDGYYRLESLNDKGYSFDNESKKDNGTQMKTYPNNNLDSQKINIEMTDDGSYKITSKYSGKVFTMLNANIDENAPVVQFDENNAIDQRWCFEPTEIADSGSDAVEDNAVYYIRNRNDGQYLDVNELSDSNGAAIVQSYFNGGKNQQFRLVKVGDYYKIMPLHSTTGKVLDVTGGFDQNSVNIELYSDIGSNAQHFKFIKNNDNGTYQIVSQCSNDTKGFDVPGASYELGVQLIQFTYRGGTNQQWILEKVSDRITASSTYTSDGNHLSTVTDSSGNTVSYDYGKKYGETEYNKGLVRSTRDAKGNLASYSYDSNNDRLLGVKTKVNGKEVSTGYSYGADEGLNSITHNGFSYSFTRDEFGNDKTVKAGDYTLESNEYEANNGNVKTITNVRDSSHVDHSDYTYNEDDQLTQISYNDTPAFQYTYDANGNLYQNNDFINGNTYQYDYDFTGSLLKETEKTQNGTINHTMTYQYDEKNRLGAFNNLVLDNNPVSRIYRTSYIYGDVSKTGEKAGLIYGVKRNNDQNQDVQQLSYTYDNLCRLNTKTINGANNYKVSYEYKKGCDEVDNISINAEQVSEKVVSGDFNGDGKKDIAALYDCGNGQTKVYVWRSTGTSFEKAELWFDSGVGNFEAARVTGRVVAGDFNGDGICDIGALYDYGNNNTGIFVFASNKSKFIPAKWYSTGAFDASQVTGRVVAGDFNGDGICDIATMYDYGYDNTGIFVFSSDKSKFTDGKWYDSGNGNFRASQVTERVAAGDFNGDGICDIVTMYDYGNENTGVFVFTSDKSKFTCSRWNVSGNGDLGVTRTTGRVVAEDFNNDKKSDLAVMYDYGSGHTAIFVLKSDGKSFTNNTWYDSGEGNYYASVANGKFVAGDFDNDGFADLSAMYEYTSEKIGINTWTSRGTTLRAKSEWLNTDSKIQKSDNKTTAMLQSIQNGSDGRRISYSYDANGNIDTIFQEKKQTDGTYVVEKQVKYTYDSLNQLVREDNQFLGKSIIYTYDTGGNITEKAEFAYTTTGNLGWSKKVIHYTYTDNSWKDKLSTYNGQTITYDNMGNPLQYRDGMTLSWKNGRELATLNKSGMAVSFNYNESSIRASKTVNGVTTKYYLHGDSVMTEITGNERFDYFYDENGDLYGFNYQSSPSATPESYYYIRNGQNDIIGILDSTGNQVVSYEYDTWGKLVSIKDASGVDRTADTSFIGYKNPYRYRGYRYDSETGLYYLNIRYYDPETGRFVSADSVIDNGMGIQGTNMYAYCVNNPVNMCDDDGQTPNYNNPFGWLKEKASEFGSWVAKKTVFEKPVNKLFTKKAISYAARAYLNSKNWILTRDMFMYAMYGGNLTKIENKIIKLLKKSQQFKDAVISLLAGRSGNIDNLKGTVELTESKDLYYSLQHIDFYVSGRKKKNGRWKITISVNDTYNFDHFRLCYDTLSIGNLANDLGRGMQLTDLLTPYSWSVTFKMTI